MILTDELVRLRSRIAELERCLEETHAPGLSVLNSCDRAHARALLERTLATLRSRVAVVESK
jgi:hypothetical protein